MSKVLLVLLLGGGLIVIGILSIFAIVGGEESMKVEDSGSQQIVLQIEGSPQTEFSGVCLVGDKEETIDGVVPQRYSYNLPNDQKLSCQIHKQNKDASTLKAILLKEDNNRSEQQTNAPSGTLELTHSSSDDSSSSSSSTNQSNSSSSSVVSSSSSSSVSSSSSTSSR